jgi:hypothetical protein
MAILQKVKKTLTRIGKFSWVTFVHEGYQKGNIFNYILPKKESGIQMDNCPSLLPDPFFIFVFHRYCSPRLSYK